jgi:peptidoglycan/xylan/chitin deacetylase (PgdA/CDA1 family)
MLAKRVKSVLGLLLYKLGLHKRVLKERALIVAFHRVADDVVGSPINCKSDDFRRYCRFLKEHFTVISMAELTKRLEQQTSIAGAAVITFDDGYRDNWHVAAPILTELGLPATFFVTTEFIGSSVQAPWDVDNGVTSRWMSWDEVRALAARRFEIGGHTANHLDLGQAEIAVADAEIRHCKIKLETELEKGIEHFAYPFGGLKNIRPATLDLVKSAGFKTCVSCHGGLVKPDNHLHALQREPITAWHVSPYHFGFELLFDL